MKYELLELRSKSRPVVGRGQDEVFALQYVGLRFLAISTSATKFSDNVKGGMRLLAVLGPAGNSIFPLPICSQVNNVEFTSYIKNLHLLPSDVMHPFSFVAITLFSALSCVQLASTRVLLDQRGIEIGQANITTTARQSFEARVSARLLTLWHFWPDLQPWAIHVKSPRGPVMNVADLTAIKMVAFSPFQKEIIETQTEERTPGSWSTPEARSTVERFIPAWHWESPRKSLSAAFEVFRDQIQAPVLRVILIGFRDTPVSTRTRQQYYVFYLDNNINHCWFVGAIDGFLYPPRTFPAPPDMSSIWIGNGSDTATS